MTPRREFLTACGGLALAAAPAAAAEFTAEDPHLEWERQLPVLRAAINAAPEEDEAAGDAAWDRYIGMLDEICLTPARTPAGIATQVRLAISSTDDGSTLNDDEVEGLRNAVRSLTSMAGLQDDGLAAEEPDEPEPLPPLATGSCFAPPDPIWGDWRTFLADYDPSSVDHERVRQLIDKLPMCSVASMGLLLQLMAKHEGGAALVALLPDYLRAAAEHDLTTCCRRG